MKPSCGRRRFFALCCGVIAGLAAHAQPAQRPIQPHVGQPGKDAVWLPTPRLLVEKMLDMAAVTPQDYVIDLGSGDGRAVIAAAKRGARALGIEYNGDLIELSKINAAREGVSSRTDFVRADFFDASLDQGTVIILFLTPEINHRLRPKLLSLRPGTRIVSNTFGLGDWKADETAALNDRCASWCTALLWIVPARVEGAWKLSHGLLELRQAFQMVSGTLRAGGDSLPISNGHVRGNLITFSAGDAHYTGRVTDGKIEGTFRRDGNGTAGWLDGANALPVLAE